MLGLAMKIGEITTASSGDQYLFAGTIAALKNRDASPAFAGLDRAQQPCGSRAKNDRIIFVDHILAGSTPRSERDVQRKSRARSLILSGVQPSLPGMIITFLGLYDLPVFLPP